MVYLCITAPLSVGCSSDSWQDHKSVGGTSMNLHVNSSDSWKAFKNVPGTSMNLKSDFGQLHVARLYIHLHNVFYVVAITQMQLHTANP